MAENELSESSKDSKTIGDSKLTEPEFSEITAQEIIINEFDNLEDWIDEQFDNLKKKCLDDYNNFKVQIPNENQNKSIDKDLSSGNEEDSNI